MADQIEWTPAMDTLLRMCRRQAMPWGAVGNRLGISASAAWKRFHGLDPHSVREREKRMAERERRAA